MEMIEETLENDQVSKIADRVGASRIVFDSEATLVRLDGDRELLGMLFEIFEQDSTYLYDQLAGSLTGRDAIGVAQAAHSLKGLVSNFEAQAATRAALAVETMASAADFDGLTPAARQLELELDELRRALRRWSC
jgi:HPt (histidine-containing phosphotransfer) domain-containing protein